MCGNFLRVVISSRSFLNIGLCLLNCNQNFKSNPELDQTSMLMLLKKVINYTNGLIHQYLPKKTNFTQVSKEEITTIQDKLNHRLRKVLNYRTPYEIFSKNLLES